MTRETRNGLKRFLDGMNEKECNDFLNLAANSNTEKHHEEAEFAAEYIRNRFYAGSET